MTDWAYSFIETPWINLPIVFDVRVLDSNDHAITLAAKKIANMATGDDAATDHSRSTCIELIFANVPNCTSVARIFVSRGPEILYKLYANDSINGVHEYQYTMLGAELSQYDRTMRSSAGSATKENHAL